MILGIFLGHLGKIARSFYFNILLKKVLKVHKEFDIQNEFLNRLIGYPILFFAFWIFSLIFFN
jgi:hypothetical protein